MKRRKAALALVVAVAFLEVARGQGAAITLEHLLGEMTDLERLADPVPPGVRLRQFSSYDRASRSPDDPTTWFANADAGHFQGTVSIDGRDWNVLAEIRGPGAVLRIWSADPRGTIRIHLDGSESPAIEADFRRLLDGEVAPFREPLAGVRSRGHNLYFPIPFARSCRILASEGGMYYHVGVRSWPEGTAVETLTPAALEAALPAIERARSLLESGLPPPDDHSRRELIDLGRPAPVELEGPGVVERILLVLAEPASEKALREHTLLATWDGAERPSVWSPLGDFFATAPGLSPYRSLPFSVEVAGRRAECRFPMPFGSGARIEVQNEGAERLAGRLEVVWRPEELSAGRLRFHAWWRGRRGIATRPFRDWTVLEGRGRGRLVGTALFVRNPTKTWWGEGDEKIRVDGEEFPSVFGTGTEDYFGYAWCDPTPFAHAYHAQTRCDGPGNRGFTAVHRFHILDDVPWERSVRFDLEVWHWADVELGYATLGYWYAERGFEGPLEPAGLADREVVAIPSSRRVVDHAIEGEAMRILEASAGRAEPQDTSSFDGSWSGEKHLWWRDARPGARLVLALESQAAGRRRLAVGLTRAPDYGVFRIRLGDRVLAERVDLYAPSVSPALELEFETDLAEGTNELAFEVVGTNPAASPRNYMLGLDYVVVR